MIIIKLASTASTSPSISAISEPAPVPHASAFGYRIVELKSGFPAGCEPYNPVARMRMTKAMLYFGEKQCIARTRHIAPIRRGLVRAACMDEWRDETRPSLSHVRRMHRLMALFSLIYNKTSTVSSHGVNRCGQSDEDRAMQHSSRAAVI